MTFFSKLNLTSKRVLSIFALTFVMGAQAHADFIESDKGIRIEPDHGKFVGNVDILFFKGHRGGWDVAHPSDSASSSQRDVQVIEMDHDLAYRINLGYQCAGQWDVMFNYMRYDGSERLSRDEGDDIFSPSRGYPDDMSETSFSNFTAKGTIDLGVFGIEVGRTYDVAERCQVRPFSGLRYVSLDQDLEITYNDDSSAEVKEKEDLSGFGLVFGADCMCELGKGFSLDGHFAASFLYSDIDLKTEHSGDSSGNRKQKLDAIIPVLEAQIALTYRIKNFSASVGFELQEWIGASHRTLEIDPENSSERFSTVLTHDLSLAGPFLRIEFRG